MGGTRLCSGGEIAIDEFNVLAEDTQTPLDAYVMTCIEGERDPELVTGMSNRSDDDAKADCERPARLVGLLAP